jgi:hypothetical protein
MCIFTQSIKQRINDGVQEGEFTTIKYNEQLKLPVILLNNQD